MITSGMTGNFKLNMNKLSDDLIDKDFKDADKYLKPPLSPSEVQKELIEVLESKSFGMVKKLEKYKIGKRVIVIFM